MEHTDNAAHTSGQPSCYASLACASPQPLSHLSGTPPLAASGKRSSRLLAGLGFLGALFISASALAQVAPVNPPLNGFGIDGDLKANTPTSPAPFATNQGDWVTNTGYTGTAVFTNSGQSNYGDAGERKEDAYNANDVIFTEGSKFNADPNTWAWTVGSAPNKNDIHNALYFVTKDANNNDWLLLGGDRLFTKGTSYIDFELYQAPITRNTANNGFTSAGTQGGRTVNDLVISMEYSNGGGKPNVIIYKWTQTAPGVFNYAPVPLTTIVPGTGRPLSDFVFAETNRNGSVDVPFTAFGSTTYQQFAFCEAAVNMTKVIASLGDPCLGLSIKTVFIKTKASDEPTAMMKDLVEPIPVEIVFGSAGITYGSYCQAGTANVTFEDGSVLGGAFTSSPTGLSINGTTGQINLAGSQPGTYTVTYTFTTNGCTKTATAPVVVNLTPSATATSDTKCTDAAGGTTAVFDLTSLESTVKGSQSGVTVSWFSNSGLTTAIATPAAYSSAGGTVYAKVSNSSAPTCFSSAAVTLNVNRTPTAATASDTKCTDAAGGTTATFDLTALEATVKGSQSGVSVSWFSNAGLTTAIATPAAYSSTGGTVYAKVSNSSATSCYSSAAVTLNVNRTPTASTASDTKCTDAAGGTTAVFDLTSLEATVKGSQTGVTVSWFSNAALTTAIATPAAYSSTGGTVYAKVSNSSAASCYSSAAVTLNVNRTPTAAPASDTKCTDAAGGTTATFDLTALEATVKGSQSGVSVSWFSNSGLTTAIATPAAYSSASGTVYAKVSNSSATSCYSSAAVTLNVNRTPTAATASDTKCTDAAGGTTAVFNLTSLEATVKGSQSGVTVSWFSNAALTTAIATPAAYSSTGGTVYAKVSNSSATSCYSSAAVTLNVNRTPTAATASDTKCSAAAGGTTAVFDLTSLEATVKGSQSGVSVSWFSNSGLTTAIATPAAYSSASGTVYAKVSNSSATSCYSSAAVTLTVNRTPTAATASAALCSDVPAGATATFDLTALEATVKGSQSGVTVSWFSNAALTTAIATPAAYSSAGGTVYAKVSNSSATSCYSSAAVTLAVSSGPVAPTLAIVNPDCQNVLGSITVTNPVNPASPAPAIYEYRNGPMGTWQTSPVFSLAAGAGYSIEVRLKDSPACRSLTTDCPSTGPAVARVTAPALTAPSAYEPQNPEQAWLLVYPNPFSMNSTLEFKTVMDGRATLEVYDLNGRLINTVYSASIEAGQTYRVPMDGSKYGEGIYIVRLAVDGKVLKSVRIVHQK